MSSAEQIGWPVDRNLSMIETVILSDGMLSAMLIRKIRFGSNFSSRKVKIPFNHHTKLEKSGRAPLIDAMGANLLCVSYARTDGINSRSIALVDHLAERTHKAHHAMLGTLSK